MQGTIAIRDVYKGYGSFTAIDHVSLDVQAGEFLTLLGPSGSGKTTLLNVLAGFIRPDAGSIKVDGVEFLTRPPHKRDVGMVFQNYALFPHMSVADNVAYPLRLRKVAGAERTRRVKAALEMVQMDHLGERGIHQLSGGQRQRVALARAIVFEPKILLMDEPLSALDKNLREHMQLELKRLHARLGMTTMPTPWTRASALMFTNRRPGVAWALHCSSAVKTQNSSKSCSTPSVRACASRASGACLGPPWGPRISASWA